MNYTAQELFEILNSQDECDWIEAKGGHESSHSVMETVCAYSNEPNLGGGYILMGVAEDEESEVSRYKVVDIDDPDKAQLDFASQCASIFNLPVRPTIKVEKINGQTVLNIWVPELSPKQKPLYFKSDGLPIGALRRIGSSDQRCTEDDMQVFYQDYTSYDTIPVKGSSIEDVDVHAIKRYKVLRGKVNPVAEELSYEDDELLEALGCVNKEKKSELNLAGLFLFGTQKAQRTTYPMIRVDYIRVPGNEWVENPDERFISIDMQGPIILLLFRLIDAINADLPKGFLLPEGEIQAESVGLPLRALREAIVNALMHRSYREHRPVQVIRYDNRIEIINPGFSLKSQDKLGEPGSETRNPFIAAVFHETNLAETKGSGIRAMRKLMHKAKLVPPTFESDRENNQFTARLLLHHFFSEEDIEWLKQFNQLKLSNDQKLALVFIKEVGAIDNQSYRQMADCDVIRAGTDLRALKAKGLLKKKGRAKATYYIAGNALNLEIGAVSTEAGALSTEGSAISTEAGALNTEPISKYNFDKLNKELPTDIREQVIKLKKREKDKEKTKNLLKLICSLREYNLAELAILLKKGENYISREFIKPMINSGEMQYKYPEMINHPDQAYKTLKK